MFVEVTEGEPVIVPRDVLAAAGVEPGDLLEVWSPGLAEIAVKVVLRIPVTGEDQRPISDTWPSDELSAPASVNDDLDRPVVTVRQMLDRRRFVRAGD